MSIIFLLKFNLKVDLLITQDWMGLMTKNLLLLFKISVIKIKSLELLVFQVLMKILMLLSIFNKTRIHFFSLNTN